MTAHVVDKPENVLEAATQVKRTAHKPNQPSFTKWPSKRATANNLNIHQNACFTCKRSLWRSSPGDLLRECTNPPPTSGTTKTFAPSNLFTAAKASSRQNSQQTSIKQLEIANIFRLGPGSYPVLDVYESINSLIMQLKKQLYIYNIYTVYLELPTGAFWIQQRLRRAPGPCLGPVG